MIYGDGGPLIAFQKEALKLWSDEFYESVPDKYLTVQNFWGYDCLILDDTSFVAFVKKWETHSTILQIYYSEDDDISNPELTSRLEASKNISIFEFSMKCEELVVMVGADIPYSYNYPYETLKIGAGDKKVMIYTEDFGVLAKIMH